MNARTIVIILFLGMINFVSADDQTVVNDQGIDCDVEYGRELFTECAACHSYLSGDMNKSGPSLHGMFGRKVATVEFSIGFSEAMRKSAIVWSEEILDDFIRNPAQLIPGTKMTYFGIDDPQDRADLICFLKDASR